MAGPPGRGDPRPLERSADLRRRNCITPASASRPRRWRTTNPMSGRRCAGSARSTTCRSMGARLSPEWARFRDGVDKRIRDRLYNFIRYCSARGIGPSSVDDYDLRGLLELPHRDDGTGIQQYRPALYGAGVECLCGRNRRLVAAAAHRAADQDQPSPPGTNSPKACAGTLTTISQVSPSPTAR